MTLGSAPPIVIIDIQTNEEFSLNSSAISALVCREARSNPEALSS